MNDLTTQVLSINESITKCQRQLQTIDKDLEVLHDFNGSGHITVGIGAHSIPFGQLLGKYEDNLQSVLITLKQQERAVWESSLQTCIDGLGKLFVKDLKDSNSLNCKPVGSDSSPWYPDLPGWTWHEITAGNEPPLERDTVINVLLKSERSRKRFSDDPAYVWKWTWGGQYNPIVAYATKNN